MTTHPTAMVSQTLMSRVDECGGEFVVSFDPRRKANAGCGVPLQNSTQEW